MAMTPEHLLAQLLSPNGNFAEAFDNLIGLGESAIPAIVAAIERHRGIPELTAVLSALVLPDPVGALAALIENSDELSEVRDPAIVALGAHHDPRAFPVLAALLPTDRFAAAEALGELGDSRATEPLLALVSRYVGNEGTVPPDDEHLRSSGGCLDLRVVLAVAVALAKLGSTRLAATAVHLATVRVDREHPEADLVRAAAVRSLYYFAAPGVAAALHSATGDRNEDTARAALLGALYLGRPDEARLLISIVRRGGAMARYAAWCLEQWSGQPLECDRDGMYQPGRLASWWRELSDRCTDRVCYRFGMPVNILQLIDELPRDPENLREELSIRTGAYAVHPLLSGNPVSPRERAEIKSWWMANASRFSPGKLHRWGRTFEPSAVD